MRGKIYLLDFGDKGRLGSEYRGERPCIVISNEKNNTYSPIVQVVIMTSKTKKKLPVHHILKKEDYPNILTKDSIVICESLQAVDKSRLTKELGELKEEDIEKIIKCIKIQLDIF